MNDSYTNPLIEKHLGTICKSIAESYKGVQSIILYGSFARGDACFEKLSDNRIVSLSDLDILVVSWFPYFKMFNRTLPSSLSALDHEINIDLNFVNRFTLKKNRFLKDYLDLKTTGQTIYGQNILKSILPVNGSNLSKYEGLRLLFNRTFSLLIHHASNRTGGREKIHHSLTVRKSAKIILDCCQALLILRNQYQGDMAGGRRCRDPPGSLEPHHSKRSRGALKVHP